MGGGARILGRRPRVLRRKGGRETLVVRLDRNLESVTQLAHELLGLECLASAMSSEGQRQTDDDSLDVVLADDLRDASQSVTTRSMLDDLERPRDRPRRIGDGDAGSRGASPTVAPEGAVSIDR